MTHFYKLSGGGNDFLALVEPASDPTSAEIEAWCARGTSEGADGVFLLRRLNDGVRMEHFNADGGRADLCLNGTRCAARLAFELGWAASAISVETDAGPFAARDAGKQEVELTLPAPGEPARSVELTLEDRIWAGWLVTVGVPHLIVEWKRPMRDAPLEVAPALRSHPDLGRAGANVDFVRFTSPHRLQIRSFERGVEAETLACGTGVLASVVAGRDLSRSELPVTALTLGGFEIRIDSHPESPDRWLMTGDARLVAEGTLASSAGASLKKTGWK